MRDPQSLHKYLYVYGDPVQGLDPSGEMNVAVQIATIGIAAGLGASLIARFAGYSWGQSATIGGGVGLTTILLLSGGAIYFPTILPLIGGAKALSSTTVGWMLGFGTLTYAAKTHKVMDEEDLAQGLEKMTSSPLDDNEAKRIAGAIANTFNNNSRFEPRDFAPWLKVEKAKGYYCYEWAYAFEDALNVEAPTKFVVQVQAAQSLPDPDTNDRLVHYFIQITSTIDPSKHLYVDDSFWDGRTYVHDKPPAHGPDIPQSPHAYHVVASNPVPRETPGVIIPRVYDSNGNSY